MAHTYLQAKKSPLCGAEGWEEYQFMQRGDTILTGSFSTLPNYILGVRLYRRRTIYKRF